ncbi:PREDICTED: probable BOI-related E3 ubiquitin-protein ligase 2 [Camelina sativa]|uniref:Probable BOI-related E3 ubiquitin-protein ligase 2 n=1 Tax=Camelina sativa TaxID=90675 RepID=A0ABM0VU20_CAMSA|nr:PREDICTED: probable BOI-related E3 ubiquitin-protein ligase 2 [Camelina sativa]
MAVQAHQHHSSNLILHNKRNGKDKEQDLSLQSQTVFEQTNMLFNYGGCNQRKRGRETKDHHHQVLLLPQQSHHQVLLLPQQSHHQLPQVIDLSLLQHNYNHTTASSNMVHTGLRLSSGDDHTQKIRPNLFSGSFEGVLSAHYNWQSEELDELLRSQAEELRRTLVERRKKHYKALIGAVEEPLVRKLKEKEAEIERATRRHNELVARESQLRAEAEAWQGRAKAQEAAAASLQAQLHQAVNKCGGVSAEEGLVLGAEISGVDDAESAYVDPERMKRPTCKACRKMEATVVMLPCRHMSICPGCDRTALACPLCLTLRSSSVEAILC